MGRHGTAAGKRFRIPAAGGALYHESACTLGRWHLAAGLRLDVEHTRLRYDSRTVANYTATDRRTGVSTSLNKPIEVAGRLERTFAELLPRFCVLYAFDEVRNLYLTVSKGYKAGGFNTQMFSDVLQQEMTAAMGFGRTYDVDDVVTYEPEQSWNYELGGHFSCMEGAVRGDFALFWIDCRNQQLTVFPEGSTTGRLMTNAGRTRSFGAEAAVRFTPWRNLGIDTSYGYTDARFVRYDNGQEDFGGNRIPYAPQHTFSARAVWTLPTASPGWATSCCKPASAARDASGGTKPIRCRNPSTRSSTPRCASNTPAIRSVSGAATSPAHPTTSSISSPWATNSSSADVPARWASP